MIELVVVDSTAENRRRLIEQLTEYLKPGNSDIEYLPGIRLTPLSPQELRFHAAPDICIVGAGLLGSNITELGKIKQLFPETPCMVELPPNMQSIAVVEQLARYGAENFITSTTGAQEFIRTVIVLARKNAVARVGKLFLVDSGKGGVGVTSIAAGIADMLLDTGKKVLVIDLDHDTQDVSRFLQARPFVNENLHSILSGNRPVTHEFVEECLVSVWEGLDSLYVLPPVPECDSLFDPRNPAARIFISVLEVLDTLFDFIIVDMGNVRGTLLRALYRAADGVFFVVNNDAATLYASVDRVQRVRALLPPDSLLHVVENGSQKYGLPQTVLRREFSRAAQITEEAWSSTAIPFCRSGHTWPGSGGTLYSQGSAALKNSFLTLLAHAGVIPSVQSKIKPVADLWCLAGKKIHAVFPRDRGQRSQDPKRCQSQKALPQPELSTPATGLPSVQRVSATAESDLVTTAIVN